VASRHTPPAAATVAALAAMYQESGVHRWQLWVHEADRRTSAIGRAAGLVVDTTTMTMAMDLTVADLEGAPSLPHISDAGIEDARGVLSNPDVFVPMLRACGACLYAVRYDGEPASCV